MHGSTGRVAARAVAAVVIGLMLGGIGVIGTGAPVAACSCMELSPREQFDIAEAVFVGTVVDDWSQPPPTSGEYSSDLPRWLTFDTTEVYKGEVFETQTIRTNVDAGACGLELRGAGPFLIFGSGAGSEYGADLCGGSRLLEPDGVPPGFGDPTPPAPGSSASSRPDQTTTTAAPTPVTTIPDAEVDSSNPTTELDVGDDIVDEDEDAPVDKLATFSVPVLILLAALATFVIVRSARHR